MKKNIHPENYRLVVFKDTSCDHTFLTRSTVETKETIKWDDGNEYPLCKIEISICNIVIYLFLETVTIKYSIVIKPIFILYNIFIVKSKGI